ncbi:ABC transporter ATP-binding protein [Pseudanabaena yagii]|uniref:ABC transporter ATP-binding protein n=1 Tax=Pseudanabaena yagii GIHE-NHR1 TaxID=2722753 RepID=A0ABX1M1B7_9CYAN|nr:ABC transporter ATP-binding protein [Pseudanabaena yagii]NMF60990.1 ABC transporter ATP-binding protein [Pseudanabaena yagii GIHE-NHR1]
MSDVVIRVENLSKKYIIGHQKQERYTALRDVVSNGAKSLWQGLTGKRGKDSSDISEEFWALKDVSFEVKQGDRVGIIGRNGAGKSTLLKILSRITEPTAGKVRIKGRVSSLLEVGTGFHPELTGRENIFLNGAVLGMDRAEITKKFDEIVEFAEVEKFLDTPVKHYSSGMYVRLAFAVAAHLEPEILIIDEVLAVGDAQFQKKCLGKMKDVSCEGRTVLFVSHSMPTITSLCENVILLENGQISEQGSSAYVISKYYSSGELSTCQLDFSKVEKVVGDNYARLIYASVMDENNEPQSEVLINKPLKVMMHFRILEKSNIVPVPAFDFRTSDGTYAFGASPDHKCVVLDVGDYTYECHVPANFLNEGIYFVTLNLHSFTPYRSLHFQEMNALTFNIRDPIDGTRNHDYSGPVSGVVRPQFQGGITKIS